MHEYEIYFTSIIVYVTPKARHMIAINHAAVVLRYVLETPCNRAKFSTNERESKRRGERYVPLALTTRIILLTLIGDT